MGIAILGAGKREAREAVKFNYVRSNSVERSQHHAQAGTTHLAAVVSTILGEVVCRPVEIGAAKCFERLFNDAPIGLCGVQESYSLGDNIRGLERFAVVK